MVGRKPVLLEVIFKDKSLPYNAPQNNLNV